MRSGSRGIWRAGGFCFLLVASLAWAGPGKKPEPIRVLFIGNSYTCMNDLPGLVEALGRHDSASEIETEMVTDDGMTLERHWQAGDALRLIDEGTWDFVVLQSQSTFGERHFVDGKRRIEGTATFHEYARKLGHSTGILDAPALGQGGEEQVRVPGGPREDYATAQGQSEFYRSDRLRTSSSSRRASGMRSPTPHHFPLESP